MDEKIEITEKAVRKSAAQEKTFVDMLNQEVKELQKNMGIVNLENELSNIQTYAYMEIYPCRQKQPNRIVAEHLIMKGYRKESDTAREIFDKIFEVLCCFTTQGKSQEYNEGYIDCLAEVDKRLQNLAKEKYEVNNG